MEGGGGDGFLLWSSVLIGTASAVIAAATADADDERFVVGTVLAVAALEAATPLLVASHMLTNR